MDRDDRLRARADRVRETRRIEIERPLGDVHEHRPRAHGGNRRRCGDERVRGGDHVVSRPDTERAERELERRRARADAHGMPHAAVLGEPSLEFVELRAADERGTGDDAGDRRVDLRLELLVLLSDGDEAHSHASTSSYAARHCSAV